MVTIQDIEDAVGEMYQAGIRPNRIRGNVKMLQGMMGLSPQSWFWQNPDGLVFRVLHTPFGLLTVEIADDAPNGKIYIDNKEHTEQLRVLAGESW